jgi:hypothetical protein
MFAGARDESDMQFGLLCDLLREFVYPQLQRLYVNLCGPEVSTPQSQTDNVHIQVIKKFVEKAFPMQEALQIFDAIYIIAPGFSDNLSQWDPAINLMLSCPKSLPVILTSYSNLEKKDNDALFDENCMRAFWRSNVLVPSTENPKYDPFPRGALGHKNRWYHICQGRNESLPRVARQEFKRNMTAEYLRYMADYYHRSHVASSFLQLAEDLTTGALAYAEEKNSYFVSLANKLANH